VYAARNHITSAPLLGLHYVVLHRVRRLGIAASASPDDVNHLHTLAKSVVGGARDGMAKLLEVDQHELSCCLKLGEESPENGRRIGTWARSDPTHDRPSDSQPLEGNTVWCSLFGEPDGSNMWDKPFNCFSSNNLTKNGSRFQCTRDGWDRYYKSVLVYPLRLHYYEPNPDGGPMSMVDSYTNVGFLAFDSPNTNVFRGMPESIELERDFDRYLRVAAGNAAFHYGAIIADALSISLREWFAAKNDREDEPHAKSE
jgi:hypothetical protein